MRQIYINRISNAQMMHSIKKRGAGVITKTWTEHRLDGVKLAHRCSNYRGQEGVSVPVFSPAWWVRHLSSQSNPNLLHCDVNLLPTIHGGATKVVPLN